MRAPLKWLKDYVEINTPVPELAHKLTLAGLEVGDTEYIGIPDPDGKSPHLVWDREKIVLGHILEVKAHPDADRLVLAMVDSGIGEIETCVTGAPNLYPYKGKGPLDKPLVAAYAREGAEVIDAYKENDPYARMILKPRKLRGIMNKTMVCSEKELGISDEHEGIMLFESDAAPGTPLQDVLGDVIFDFELTPNLARCFSMVGIAREIAAVTGAEMQYPSTDVLTKGASIDGQVEIEIREPELNQRFTLALIKNIEIKPSPFWMQDRLKKVGMRPINNIVDVTNYGMMEWGEPLHAFDYDILVERAKGKTPKIITRLPEKGEKLTTLDDVERELDDFTILVTDTAGALSLGGIMGGLESEVTDETTSVLLEAATWNFINIRKTLSAQRRRNMEISSEAAIRFSRGVHPAVADKSLLTAIERMRLTGGGEVAKGIIDSYPLPQPEVTVNLPMEEVERILGIPLTRDEVADILKRLEFKVKVAKDGSLDVTAPDHRLDIGYLNFPEKHEDIREVVGRADLMEEIARIYGYDRIPNTLLVNELPPQRSNDSLSAEEKIRDILVREGLQEIVCYRFTTPERESRLTPEGAESNWPDNPYVKIANPISADRTSMRHTLLASMLEIMSANARWQKTQSLFEIGAVYLPVEGENLPSEPRHLCIGMTGERHSANWQDAGNGNEGVMDFYDLKGVVEGLVEKFDLESLSYKAAEHSSFRPGRTAALIAGGKEIGVFGELHPKVVGAFNIEDKTILAAEINLEELFEAAAIAKPLTDISIYPEVYQDLAIIVDETIPASEVEELLKNTGGFLLRKVDLFDLYTGEQVGAGKKSLAYKLAFQAPNRTLRDKDVEKLRKKIVKTLRSRLGAELRG